MNIEGETSSIAIHDFTPNFGESSFELGLGEREGRERTVNEKYTVFCWCEATEGRNDEEIYRAYDGRYYSKPLPDNYWKISFASASYGHSGKYTNKSITHHRKVLESEPHL